MINASKIKNFWERRGAKFVVPSEEIANFEPNPDLQELKIKREREMIAAKLKLNPSFDILDLGAGYGQWAMRFAPRVKSVTAVEYARSMLEAGEREVAKRRITNINFVHSSAEDFAPVRQYDVVFISGLFMYLNDRQSEKVAEVANRALSPGGTLFLRESVSLLNKRYAIEDRWSDAIGANYSALYRTRAEFVNLFDKLTLVGEDFFFPDGSPLNKWQETRLRYFIFKKAPEL